MVILGIGVCFCLGLYIGQQVEARNRPVTPTLKQAINFDEAFEEAVCLDENVVREEARWRVWKNLAGHPRNAHPAFKEGYRLGEEQGRRFGYNKAVRERRIRRRKGD